MLGIFRNGEGEVAVFFPYTRKWMEVRRPHVQWDLGLASWQLLTEGLTTSMQGPQLTHLQRGLRKQNLSSGTPILACALKYDNTVVVLSDFMGLDNDNITSKYCGQKRKT